MTIPELIKDFFENAKERLKNPFSGALLWSLIIYNWRPLFLLMFSDAIIEDKIVVINHEYCKIWGIIVPLIMAIIYTVGLPFLMLQFEKILRNTTKKRIGLTYDTREDRLDGKITLADKEFTLKNKLSGNKEIQDYLDEIESLKEQVEIQKESIKQINETNKTTIDELNASLKNANRNRSNNIVDTDEDRYNNFRNAIVEETKNLEKKLSDEIIKIVINLNFTEFQVLKDTNITIENGFFLKTKTNESILGSLKKKKIIDYTSDNKNFKATLTQIGQTLVDIIKTY